MGKTTKRSHHQTGKTHIAKDRRITALPPGQRRSSGGKKYTENRRNRSDMSRSRRL